MKVLIFDRIYVPGHGMGPFITPIEIDDPRLIARLKARGRIKVIVDRPKKEEPIKMTPPEIIYEDSVVEEIIIEEPIEVVVEELPVEEEEVVEELPVEEVEVVEELPTREELEEETISMIKERLKAKGIRYLYKDTKKELIDKLLGEN